MAVAEKESAGIGKKRALLLGLLVIAGVVGAIQLGGGSGDDPAPKQYVDNDVVEVSPLVPSNRMSGASWRSAEQVREDRAAEDATTLHGESALDKQEWGEDDDRREYEKSVEDAVKEIDGLGVYVAPADAKPAKPGKAAPKKGK